jgi:DNA-binding MarR family transcriptional regulator
LKVELLLQGSKMLQYCYRLPERTVKEIARILKTERSYIDEPSFKMPVVEVLIIR